MHAVSFAVKRAHLRAVAFGKKVVEDVDGMTPARFDLLYLLRRFAIANEPPRDPLAPVTSQAELCKTLGLHRTTVARMVKRLVQFGWIARTRARTDRRTFVLALTALGLRKIGRAMRRVFRARLVRRAYETIYRRAWPERPVVGTIEASLHTLGAISHAFGDRSRVWYHYGGKVPPFDLDWLLAQPAAMHRHCLRAGVPAWPPPRTTRRQRRRLRDARASRESPPGPHPDETALPAF